MSNTTPWCNRHNKPAHFSGSRGLTCGYPGQESCWITKTAVRCPECERIFNLLTEADADEWTCGHDCEVTA